jgi:glycine betaine/choline ABC-type transport system substrate-binding protein
MREALVNLGGRISADDMRAMNFAADGQRKNPADVARGFLDGRR